MKNMAKRLLASALALVLISAVFPPCAFAATIDMEPVRDWTGYTPISNIKELESIMDDPYGKYYLTKDIDMGSTYNNSYGDGKGWKPLGKGYTLIPETIVSQESLDKALEKYPAVYVYDDEYMDYYGETVYKKGTAYYYLDAFYGILDGNGHALKQMNSYRSADLYGGLFSYNCGIITDITFFSGRLVFAGCSGSVSGVNYGIITDCIAKNSNHNFEDSGSYRGGITGINYGYISGCSNFSTVWGESFSGGIVGANFGTIRNCSNGPTSSIKAEVGWGGIAGVAYASIITECVDNRGDNDMVGNFFNETVGYIVGYDLGGEEYPSYYRNCFYYFRNNPLVSKPLPRRAVGNIANADLEGGLVPAREITSDMNKSSLGAYLNFDYEWYESPDGKAYPMSRVPASDYEVSALWDGHVVSKFAYGYGSGTAQDPYKIRTVSQLAYVQEQVMKGQTYENTYFILLGDLEINDTTVECWFKNAAEWRPIGDSEHPFLGHIDGCGYTVKGLYIDRPYESETGLFGYIGEGAVIENLNVEGYVRSYGDSGVLVAVNDGGTVRNCNVSGYTEAYMGGALLCGLNMGDIRSCETAGRISGGVAIGGICAYNLSEIAECANSARIFSFGYDAAGVCALNLGMISDCFNTGNVTANDVGAGICAENMKGKICSSYSTGTILASSYSGSVCGYTGNVPVENCYYLKASAKSCAGEVQNGIGGEFGSVILDMEGATAGLTATQMKSEDTFSGFDFVWVWTMLGDNTYQYPELRSIIGPPTGDVNGDGVISAIDSNLLKRKIAGNNVDIDSYNADLSGNRSLSAEDSFILKLKIAGGV